MPSLLQSTLVGDESGVLALSRRILVFSYSINPLERQTYRPLSEAACTEAGETEHVVFRGSSFREVNGKSALLHGSLL